MRKSFQSKLLLWWDEYFLKPAWSLHVQHRMNMSSLDDLSSVPCLSSNDCWRVAQACCKKKRVWPMNGWRTRPLPLLYCLYSVFRWTVFSLISFFFTTAGIPGLVIFVSLLYLFLVLSASQFHPISECVSARGLFLTPRCTVHTQDREFN